MLTSHVLWCKTYDSMFYNSSHGHLEDVQRWQCSRAPCSHGLRLYHHHLPPSPHFARLTPSLPAKRYHTNGTKRPLAHCARHASRKLTLVASGTTSTNFPPTKL